MKPETFQPTFPPLFTGLKPVWGQGNNLCLLNLLASIPLFTLEKEGSRKRKKMEKAYWEGKDKEYKELKKIYKSNCRVGTVWAGNTSASAKITKIVINEDKAYICFKASDQHIQDIEEQNKKTKYQLKPIKSGKYRLDSFLSAIKNKTIRIISAPKLV